MHDCENEVYTRVAEVLREKFPGIDIAGTYVPAPSKFPHVSIEMTNCDTLRMLQASQTEENFDRVVFDVNVYSNDSELKKSICKEIVAEINQIIFEMNFSRLYQRPVHNFEDMSIYRIVTRYRAATDGKYFYRR